MTTYQTNLTTLEGQAQDRAADDSLQRFAGALSPPPPGLANRQPELTRRWAIVQAVNSNGTVNITLDGAVIAGVGYLSSYSPAANDPVIIDFLGPNPMVIGTPATGSNASGVPTGAIIDYAGGTVLTGYLACNGAAVSRTIYSVLFNRIGTSWGAGDGSTTFNIPDIRGRTTLGAGTGSGLTARSLAQTGGAETTSHTHTSAAHSHTLSDAGVATLSWAAAGTIVMRRVSSSVAWTATSSVTETALAGNTTSNTNSLGLAGNTDSATPGVTGAPSLPAIMPPFAVVTKMIKT